MRVKILALGLICLFISCTTVSMSREKIRREYFKLHPGVSPQVRDAILNADVLIGMNSEQVIASRGRPHEIKKTTTKSGIHEQWVMVASIASHHPRGGGLFGISYGLDKKANQYAYIYFENGKVTNWKPR